MFLNRAKSKDGNVDILTFENFLKPFDSTLLLNFALYSGNVSLFIPASRVRN